MTSIEILTRNLSWYWAQAKADPDKKEIFGNQAFGAVTMWIDLNPAQEEFASKLWENNRSEFGF